MHGPFGFLGLQTFLNNLQSDGYALPKIILPHMQPDIFSSLTSLSSKTFFASLGEYSSLNSSPEAGIYPMPLQLTSETLKYFSMSRCACILPSGLTTPL